MLQVQFPPGYDEGAIMRPLRHNAWKSPAGAEYRRSLCAWDPLYFTLTYLGPMLTDQTTGKISLAEMHMGAYRIMAEWADPGGHRDALVGARDGGKSTSRMAGTLWALCYGHRKSLASFSRTEKQAQGHIRRLLSILQGKHRLISPLLLNDFPWMRASGAGEGRWRTESGAWLTCHGLNSTSLGEVNDEFRPDMVIGDDIQRNGAKVTRDEVAQAKEAITGGILPMNSRAAVLILGTAFEPWDLGSDIVNVALKRRPESEDGGKWLTGHDFRCHYYPADWPQKWSRRYLAELKAKDLRAYAQAYEPHLLGEAAKSPYWSHETHRRVASFATETDPYEIQRRAARIISIDCAVGRGGKNDYTAIVVMSRSPDARRCCIEHVEQDRHSVESILRRIESLWQLAPDDGKPTLVLWERNQGGEMLAEKVDPLPPGMTLYRSTEKDGRRAAGYRVTAHKETRIARLHLDVTEGKVFILMGAVGRELYERQANSWSPKSTRDDVLDGASGGARYLLYGFPEM